MNMFSNLKNLHACQICTVNSLYNETQKKVRNIESSLYRNFQIFNGKNLLLYQEREDRTEMLIIHHFYQEL